MKILIISLIAFFASISLMAQEKELPVKDKEEQADKMLKYDELFLESMNMLGQIIIVIEDAKGPKSNTIAIAKLEELSKKALKHKRLCEKAGLDSLSQSDQAKLSSKYKSQIRELSLKLLNAIQLAKANKELSKTLDEILKNL